MLQDLRRKSLRVIGSCPVIVTRLDCPAKLVRRNVIAPAQMPQRCIVCHRCIGSTVRCVSPGISAQRQRGTPSNIIIIILDGDCHITNTEMKLELVACENGDLTNICRLAFLVLLIISST